MMIDIIIDDARIQQLTRTRLITDHLANSIRRAIAVATRIETDQTTVDVTMTTEITIMMMMTTMTKTMKKSKLVNAAMAMYF